jgi:hypothetical protein
MALSPEAWTAIGAIGGGLVVAGGKVLVDLVRAGAEARGAERTTQLPAAPQPAPAPQVAQQPAQQVIDAAVNAAVQATTLAAHETRITKLEATVRELEVDIAGELAELTTTVQERTARRTAAGGSPRVSG